VARPLGEDDRETIVDVLEEETGQSVRLHVEKDEGLIGGLVIRIGDRVFDGSVRNKLANLHDRLRESALTTGPNGQAA
jgi:F-type H+-transporting ATPase subunit delta